MLQKLSLFRKLPFPSKILTFPGNLDFKRFDLNEEDEMNENERVIEMKINRDVGISE
jgi:hypothetical protein